VYTALATVVREAGTPTVVATFLDYTPTTLADDFGVAAGDGPNAYNEWHRADAVLWSR